MRIKKVEEKFKCGEEGVETKSLRANKEVSEIRSVKMGTVKLKVFSCKRNLYTLT